MTDKMYSEWNIMFEHEDTYGEDPATSREWIGIVQPAEASDEKIEREVRGAGLTGRDKHDILTERFSYTGSIPFWIQHGKVFQYIFGKVTTTGTDPYTHEIEYDDNLDSVTLEIVNTSKTDDWVREYTGVKFNTLTLSGGIDEELEANLEWFAQDKPTDKQDSGSTVTADDRDPYMWKHCSFYLDDGSGSYENIDDEITSFEVEINNNLSEKQKAGTDHIREPDEGPRDISVTIDFDLTDKGHTDLVDEEDSNIKFKIEAEREEDDEFTLEIEDLTVISFDVPIEQEEVVAGTLNAEGLSSNDTLTFKDSIENYNGG